MNYIVALLLFYIKDEEQVFWCFYQIMHKYDWRSIFKQGFPKLMELSEYLNERLIEEFPRLLRHLEDNCLVVTQGIFTGHFMTFGMNNCPVEIAARLFEMFILDGEQSFMRLLLRMFELRQDEMYTLTDVSLQNYIHTDLITSCITSYPMRALVDDD